MLAGIALTALLAVWTPDPIGGPYDTDFDPAARWNGFLQATEAVVWCESKGRADAVNPASGAAGLYQLAPVHRRRAERLGWTWEEVSTDALANTAVAFNLYIEQGLGPWESSRGCWEP